MPEDTLAKGSANFRLISPECFGIVFLPGSLREGKVSINDYFQKVANIDLPHQFHGPGHFDNLVMDRWYSDILYPGG